MLASPIALPVNLPPSVELAAIQLREKVYTSFPAWTANALSSVEVFVAVSIMFDSCGQYEGLKVALQSPIPNEKNAINFSCCVSVTSFEDAKSQLLENVVKNWISSAVERRLKFGRELIEYSDEDIVKMIKSFRYICMSSCDHIDIQAHFFSYLAKRELELRTKPLSNHETLAEKKKISPLCKQLGKEISRAKVWWARIPSDDREGAVPFIVRDLPEEGQMVYAYRVYRMSRYGAHESVNQWGEISHSLRSEILGANTCPKPFVISV
ncbi:hypothetical protein [Sulfitobacter sp. M39]|uniref:hypothetical protein n=1 Tax=Sulfitobacter sp. M39 TaxID=2675334 RepID=UPI001F206EA7|nr:hypothetical protein [Sulfitobacter sp. M39]